MTKLRTYGRLTLASAQSAKGGNISKLSLSKVACVIFAFCAVAVIASPAQTFKTLVSFDGTNGAEPFSTSLVQGLDGKFYGTTEQGGANYVGTVFKITAAGKLTTLHTFNGNDGAYPGVGLVQATDGNLYGTNFYGGFDNIGTVFKITPAGVLTTLHTFNGNDGAYPGALVQAADGNFYGITQQGGAYCGTGCGTIFRITAGGTLTTLHSFDYTDGLYPVGGLVQATNGNFYGTTEQGGSGGGNNCTYGCGTVFKITAAGTFTSLHSFPNETDGAGPLDGLVQATNGNFYGTTSSGGANGNYGTVFKITPAGKLTTLHSFGGTDGFHPFGGLVQATDGSFYGMTQEGGADGYGTVFKINAAGRLTTLHTFDFTDGAYPVGGLLQASNGNFYGTPRGGGTSNACGNDPGCGTVFSLSVGLGPFVETLPTSGKIGTKVMILGNNLTGATSVTFDGTAAKFKVFSKSEITTTVPEGGTTGTVEVTTPKGTLKSNVFFRVTK